MIDTFLTFGVSGEGSKMYDSKAYILEQHRYAEIALPSHARGQ